MKKALNKDQRTPLCMSTAHLSVGTPVNLPTEVGRRGIFTELHKSPFGFHVLCVCNILVIYNYNRISGAI